MGQAGPLLEEGTGETRWPQAMKIKVIKIERELESGGGGGPASPCSRETQGTGPEPTPKLENSRRKEIIKIKAEINKI